MSSAGPGVAYPWGSLTDAMTAWCIPLRGRTVKSRGCKIGKKRCFNPSSQGDILPVRVPCQGMVYATPSVYYLILINRVPSQGTGPRKKWPKIYDKIFRDYNYRFVEIFMFTKMSFEGKNGKSSLKYQKFLQFMVPPRVQKKQPLRSKSYVGSVFWYPLGHSTLLWYYFTPYSLSCSP